MKAKQQVRAGVFEQLATADEAVDDLVAAGVPKGEIQVVCPRCDQHHFAGCKEVAPSGARTTVALEAGAAAGAALGTALGVVLVIVAGMGSSALLPILAAAVSGAVVGGFIGAMMTRAREPEIADFYDQALEHDRILVAVKTSSEGDPHDSDAERIFAKRAVEAVALPVG